MRHCGTAIPGWLNGAHPTIAEGVVTRRVCFSSSDTCCYRYNNVRIKNCGAYFLYQFSRPYQCYAGYCGNANAVDGCKNYTVLSEADRAQGHVEINNNFRCDARDLVPGWYRFQGAAGDRMAEKCVPMNHCGSDMPVWFSDPHPTIAEGVVIRKVCFHYSNKCCFWRYNIRIKNCGAYFVYELLEPRSCSARYCGNGVAVDGCKNYTVLSEADRAQGHIVINSNYRCDRDDLVPRWYRFQGAAGDQMADKCVPENHCGTHYPGWLNGTHPTVAEGVVTRRVCYHNSLLNSCCVWHDNIRVKNCGAYFVYELPRPRYCYTRYCGNRIAVVTCHALPSTPNSLRYGCTGNSSEYPHDTICRFSCFDGYKAIGSNERRCQQNGLWSGGEFSCQPVTCPRLSPPSNGELLGCNTTKMLYKTVCRFSCNEGFEAKGSMVRSCTENGTWSATDVVCEACVLRDEDQRRYVYCSWLFVVNFYT
ncbi:oncoprotein-induced transcript 3 protein-like isoform X2 [Orbicella faveolata]|uniref:oncoprotein-induced transcript 3 protein-like isoform X2 n=1 Tax=Orbicella faveolata TaxID=48498 RepID=UPI0009E2E66C|nr:oncoprotein-induced transcript 3 protein-like isoform X2 [Orbicella faveolata]